MSRESASPSPDPTPPNADGLYQAALSYVARYAATEAGLRRILARRIDRWAHAQPDPDATQPIVHAARAAIDTVVERLAKTGALSDTTFAENRARSLVRRGQSNRAIQMRLIAKGVAPDTARTASKTDTETELAAALVLARKRRVGPYRRSDSADATIRKKELALLARAGFSRDIAQQVLETSEADAETRIFELRRERD
jgi:regulatory protein